MVIQAEHGKLDTPPKGLRGGLAGAGGRHFLNAAPIPDKQPVTLREGDVVRILTPGSGGMGPPHERERATVAADIDNGVVSPESAARDYGYQPEDRDLGRT
jgi:N-methylhydantoinase B